MLTQSAAHTPGQETFDIRPGCRIYKEYVILMDYAEMLDIFETLQEVVSGYITQKGTDASPSLPITSLKYCWCKAR